MVKIFPSNAGGAVSLIREIRSHMWRSQKKIIHFLKRSKFFSKIVNLVNRWFDKLFFGKLTCCIIIIWFSLFWLHWVFVGCTWTFSSRGEQWLLSSCGSWASHCVASLVAEHGLWASTCQLQHAGSIVVAHGFSCPVVCGVLVDKGSNLCPLHWQVDS